MLHEVSPVVGKMMQRQEMRRACSSVAVILVSMGGPFCVGASMGQAVSPVGQLSAPAPTASDAETITLQEAIRRARSIDTTYAGAVADDKIAQAQRTISRSTLLPGVVYHNQFLYTQGQRPIVNTTQGTSPAPVFIANNGVHEYMSEGVVTETIGAAGVVGLKRVSADAAAAKARLEVARRGLVSSVVDLYYGALVTDAKASVAGRALDEAKHFQTISGQLEQGGEVAHADVVKSNLEVQQRERDRSDATLAAEQARLELGVLLFADPRTKYTLPMDLEKMPDMPTREEVAAAASGNPDVKAALASFKAAQLDVTASRLAYLPSLGLNYVYGIDANQFAIRAPDGTKNLGYAAYATLDIPVWDWFATHGMVKQSEARRQQAQVELTSTQRKLLASMESLYKEAEVARADMASLGVSVQGAQEALRLTDLRYTSGEATILEVVDAQTTVIAVEDSKADAAARYATALANLQTLTGNLP
jgi:outer membrane protein TolC